MDFTKIMICGAAGVTLTVMTQSFSGIQRLCIEIAAFMCLSLMPSWYFLTKLVMILWTVTGPQTQLGIFWMLPLMIGSFFIDPMWGRRLLPGSMRLINGLISTPVVFFPLYPLLYKEYVELARLDIVDRIVRIRGMTAMYNDLGLITLFFLWIMKWFLVNALQNPVQPREKNVDHTDYRTVNNEAVQAVTTSKTVIEYTISARRDFEDFVRPLVFFVIALVIY